MRNMSGEMEQMDTGGRMKETKLVMGRVRSQAMLVRRISEQLKMMAPDGLRAIALSGTPRTGRNTCGLDAKLEKREALERMLERESGVLREYEKAARQCMETMKPEHYAFSAMYYIAAMSMEDVSRALDRSLRQVMRYKREIEQA